MSSIEERLLRDIAEVTGGVVMTDSDLRDARESLDERIDNRRQRDRRRTVAVAAAAAVVLVGIAGWQVLQNGDASPTPAPPGPEPSELSPTDQAFLTGDAPTTDLLAGLWRLDNPTSSRMLFLVTADGGIQWDDTGQLAGDPQVSGTYAIDGDQVTVEVEGGSADCSGQTLTLRAVVSVDGTLHVVPVELGTDRCGNDFRAQWVLEKMLPTSAGWRDLTAPPGANWDPPEGHEVLLGNWFDPRGRYVLELRPDGTFTSLTGPGVVANSGTWEDQSATKLTLRSSGEVGECQQGDLFVLNHLRARDVGAMALQGDLGRNDCGIPWEGKGWFRLAP
jgi:hypothetical protein